MISRLACAKKALMKAKRSCAIRQAVAVLSRSYHSTCSRAWSLAVLGGSRLVPRSNGLPWWYGGRACRRHAECREVAYLGVCCCASGRRAGCPPGPLRVWLPTGPHVPLPGQVLCAPRRAGGPAVQPGPGQDQDVAPHAAGVVPAMSATVASIQPVTHPRFNAVDDSPLLR